jgi:hypothetical protein
MDAATKTLKAAGSAASSSNSLLSTDDASAGSNPVTSGEKEAAAVTLATLQEAVKAHKEWAKHLVFDGDGRVLFGNVKPLEGEVAYVMAASEPGVAACTKT